ncbi:MAG: VOC family protein [Bacteroides sp.]|jgi:catechol 2,3-dioxygenase-like lactoylglutathione lyase family enzyme|nr:VOC family protein [Bacteroides sp.]
MKNYLICGIQQIGIGVTSLPEAWQWYITHFGMDIRMFEEAAYAEYMLPYTGNQPQKRHAVLAINLQGGGGFEVWQYADRKPVYPSFTPQLGDLGIFACKMKSFDVTATHARLKGQGLEVTPLQKDPGGEATFFITDPWGNVFQFVKGSKKFYDEGKDSGGVHGIVTGVSDADKAIQFYSGILGFDQVVYDMTGTFEDLAGLQGGQQQFRRVLLSHSKPFKGPFSKMFGPAAIELVQALESTPRKIYEGRFWGDPGFIQLCFDVQGFDALRDYCKASGNPFTVNSQEKLSQSFDMGEAAGHFAYIEDPDGTLIELVETHKIPVVKKLGWYINLDKRKMGKPLPTWMLKTLRFNRVK